MSNPKFVMVATWSMAYESLKAEYDNLQAGKAINQPIIDAIKVIEDYPFYKSVGYGGLLNRHGRLQLDASFMEGDTLKVGAVAAMEGVANPIEVAYSLKDQQYNSFLAGRGAEEYARANNFQEKNMVTAKALELYEERQRKIIEEALVPYSGHDTVCILGMDIHGSISVGTSTSGLFMKETGRVGDSPISGSGFYANSDSGACAATGLGEDIMKTCVSYEAVRLMEEGHAAQTAADLAVAKAKRNLLRRYQKCGDISIVCCDKHGNFGAATTIDEFSYVAFNHAQKPTIFLVTNTGEHQEASAAWIKSYFDVRGKTIKEQ
ncbi:N(4)-(beta-N-acetylglucosaminyl)-L-asparaginase [Mollicutes bacterium LVI A0039]|nr:N(4)-(beta-N-acetylglucosaminyl)-L-asparaginase [Mollicutes bacterium LVI A0039]